MTDAGKTKRQLISELEMLRQRLAAPKFGDTSTLKPELLYETFANSSPVGVYIYQDGKLCFVNSQFQKSTGYSEAELLGMTPRQLIEPDDRISCRQNATQMLKGLRTAPYEFRVIRKTGETIWVMETVTSITFNGRRATLGNYMDITERKKAEEALRESEERYSALVNLGGRVGEAIVMLQDINGVNSVQTFVSDEWPRITGFSKQELIGKSFIDLLHPRYRNDSLNRHKKKIGGETMPDLFEMSIIRKDGAEVPIELTSAFTAYKGRLANVAFIRDITERKMAEERLLEYQQELRSLAAQLSLAEERERRTIATELHDRISQSLALCNIKLGALIELSSSTNYLTKNLSELRQLISQMIKETRTLSFSISSPLLYVFGLDAAIEQLAEDMQDQYGISFEFSAASGFDPLEDDIRVLIYRTVYEIFTNIIKHANAKRVKVVMKQIDNKLRIKIEDDGVGFDINKVNDNMRKTKSFGLFSVRERLSYIGGVIEIDTSPGGGTSAVITVPLSVVKQSERAGAV